VDQLLDQTELRDAARGVLDEHRRKKNTSDELWAEMADLGWLGLAVPEACGGLGQPFSALAVLYQELGRVLAPQTFLSTSLCLDVLALLRHAGAAVEPLLEHAVSGQEVLAAIHPGAATLRLQHGRLSGIARSVLDAGEAAYLLVPVAGAMPTIVLLALPHPGVSIEHRPTWDETRQIFDVSFDGAPIGGELPHVGHAAAQAAIAHMAAHFDLALACDALGGADAIFSATLEYMQTRQQFGRPIASFQALKHRCADLKMNLEAARALVTATCHAFEKEGPDAGSMAAGCRLYAAAMYRSVTEEAVQLHGGIGFTWEHPCHRFLKRARLSDFLGGTPEGRKDAMASDLFRACATYSS
jgi:alkylation response protein AidB-like acyl-CoA dehydrogenase